MNNLKMKQEESTKFLKSYFMKILLGKNILSTVKTYLVEILALSELEMFARPSPFLCSRLYQLRKHSMW